MKAYDKWLAHAIEHPEHCPDCPWQEAPLDVCDCLQRLAFAAGSDISRLKPETVARIEKELTRQIKSGLHRHWLLKDILKEASE